MMTKFGVSHFLKRKILLYWRLQKVQETVTLIGKGVLEMAIQIGKSINIHQRIKKVAQILEDRGSVTLKTGNIRTHHVM